MISATVVSEIEMSQIDHDEGRQLGPSRKNVGKLNINRINLTGKSRP